MNKNLNKNMKNLGVLVWLLLVLMFGLVSAGFGQTSGPADRARLFTSDPTGASCQANQIGVYGGQFFTCQSGVFAAVGGGSAANVTVGTSTITGGTNTRVLYDNAGVLGEYAISGSGSVAMTTSPTFVTPTLGVASATSLALSGTAGGGFVEFLTQSSAPAAPASGFREFADSSGRKSWIRASDGFVRTWRWLS